MNTTQQTQKPMMQKVLRSVRRNQEMIGFAILGLILLYSIISSVIRNDCSIGKPFSCKLELEAFFGIGTLVLALFGYLYTREQLRLSLFEKRFAIYRANHDFLSCVIQLGGLSKNPGSEETINRAYEAADNAFRGLGFTTGKLLFGPELVPFFKEMNSQFAWFATYDHRSQEDRNRLGEEWLLRMQRSMELIEELPNIFEEYLYFGNHKF